MTEEHNLKIDIEVIKAWEKNDIDKNSREELKTLRLQAEKGSPEAIDYLNEAFKTDLAFGTAGLRAEMGPGPNKMNSSVVARAAKGISDYLLEKLGKNYKVVIGYDARYNSKDFATLSAKIITANKGKVYLLNSPQPTPVSVFASKKLKADATIVVTASHNPAEDNGYKVYLGKRLGGEYGDGVQIVPPADKEIFDLIKASPKPCDIKQKDDYEIIPSSILNEYISHVCSTTLKLFPANSNKNLKIVTTALHGVGGRALNTALFKLGFQYIWNVEEQHIPDPNFPTVEFPNPEEPGALELAIALAKKKNADIILANDPDADRCSVAIKTAKGYRQLNGDEIGSLLGNLVASQHKNKDVYLANSIVSSRLLSHIASSHNVKHTETLTGFKWIARTPKLVFGYEEAIGFCLDPDTIRDKDGISACLAIACYADALNDRNKTLQDILDIFALKFGLHFTSQLSIRAKQDLIEHGLENLKYNPPTFLASSKVVKIVDLMKPTNGLEPTPGYIFYTAANDRIIVRPSGTEPKIKCYIETIVPPEIVGPSYLAMKDMRNPMTQASGRIAQLKTDIRKATGL
ncbi:phospho-sugar mutase [Actinomyces sp. zg-332]|uniref:phospho-sugar mutase n=1 Tax=Actinomyces sp. zg-332 TaxID=2708340 RepID=UPI0014206200|nr:phospho-sugar mutase [Actinomyces sp. zg-332]QPK93969.1 phospho-sugar mutase [Actinomyces sp. zg-332]